LYNNWKWYRSSIIFIIIILYFIELWYT
jgi:hypothetical protein